MTAGGVYLYKFATFASGYYESTDFFNFKTFLCNPVKNFNVLYVIKKGFILG